MSKLYARKAVTAWKSIEVTNMNVPIHVDTTALGFMLVYESVEDFQRENPGEDYFVLEASDGHKQNPRAN